LKPYEEHKEEYSKAAKSKPLQAAVKESEIPGVLDAYFATIEKEAEFFEETGQLATPQSKKKRSKEDDGQSSTKRRRSTTATPSTAKSEKKSSKSSSSVGSFYIVIRLYIYYSIYSRYNSSNNMVRKRIPSKNHRKPSVC
jgi:hypothetical protein